MEIIHVQCSKGEISNIKNRMDVFKFLKEMIENSFEIYLVLNFCFCGLNMFDWS